MRTEPVKYARKIKCSFLLDHHLTHSWNNCEKDFKCSAVENKIIFKFGVLLEKNTLIFR